MNAKLLCLSCLLLMAFFSGKSYAHFTGKGHAHRLSTTEQVFWNPDCRSTGTCDLKRFTLITSVYELWFSDDPNHPTYGNGAIMEYETDSVEALEKYAIVQFLRGCVFDSTKNGTGTIDRVVGYTVASFGEEIPFCFPDWVIDSHDTDPVYNSDPAYGRFYFLRWNRPGSYEYPNHKYYGAEKPKIPVAYLADYPSGAFVTGTGVKNAALEFKTCIYKARDVPAQTRRDNVNFAKPLNCFEWQNVYVYNFAKGRFEADWTDVPRRGEPYLRLIVYLLVIFVTLFVAVALVTFSRLSHFLGPRERY